MLFLTLIPHPGFTDSEKDKKQEKHKELEQDIKEQIMIVKQVTKILK